MLWLRDEDLSALSGLEVSNTFTIDNLIYVIGNMDSESWQMYSIDTNNFAVTEVSVECHDFDPKEDGTFEHAIVVHKGVAYTSNYTNLLAGAFEGNVFHWRIPETSGPKPRHEFAKNSVGIFEGDTAKYVSMVEDDFSLPDEDGESDHIYYKCELDLDTMVWTRTETIKPDEDYMRYYDFIFMRILATRNNLHAISDSTTINNGFHLVMNRTTEEWNVVGGEDVANIFSGSTSCTVFSARDNIYKVGYVENYDDCALVLCRYEETTNKWEQASNYERTKITGILQVFERPSPNRELKVRLHNVVVNGSRVYIIGYNRRNRISREQLDHVIVFDLGVASLVDHSMAFIQKNNSLKELAIKILPPHLGSLLTRDATGDSLVPEEDMTPFDMGPFYVNPGEVNEMLPPNIL